MEKSILGLVGKGKDLGLKFYLGSRSKCTMEGLIHGLGRLGGMGCYQRMMIEP